MEGFELVMSNAKAYETRTGKKAAVFVVNKTTPSFTDLSNVSKVVGICCYFTTDGVEHELEKAQEIQETSNIEVVGEEIAIEPKKNKRASKNID
jgi:hypothetical protein